MPKIPPWFTVHADTWSPLTNALPPDSFDWRQRGVITLVHNQEQTTCSTVVPLSDAINSLHAIKFGTLVQISTRQLTDCCWHCDCSNLIHYRCISKLGLCSDYPYNVTSPTCTCMQGTDCDFHITGGRYVTRGNESALLQAVLINPVVASMDASQLSFQVTYIHHGLCQTFSTLSSPISHSSVFDRLRKCTTFSDYYINK